MTTPNRTALLGKLQKVLRKHYKPVVLRGDQPVLESLLFACCLENTRRETAERVFESLKTSFFDWNEVRVSTVKELAEAMSAVTNPMSSAAHLKGVLQHTFEAEYSFTLESLKKQNLGQAIKRLQKLEGASPFIVAYATQTALGGHSIPLDEGSLSVLYVIGMISENEAKTGTVPGLERAIPKSKGQEFGSLLHELGADFAAKPFANDVREILLSIASDAKERFPKRVTKKPAPEPVAAPPAPAKVAGKGATKAAAAKAVPPQPPKKKQPPVVAAKKHEPRRQPAAAHPKKKPAAPRKKAALKSLAKRKPR